MDENGLYKRAKERVEEIKGFYIHFFVYVLVNFALFLLNIITSPDALWFYWPLIGWGIGLFIHGFTVFGAHRILGRDWEERKIKELMEKDRQAGK
jgi:hypothetical protein